MTVRFRKRIEQTPGLVVGPSPAPRAMTEAEWLQHPETHAAYLAQCERTEALVHILRDRVPGPLSPEPVRPGPYASAKLTAGVLDIGLSKLTLPLVVVLDIEYHGPELVRLEIDLPPIDAVPAVVPGVNVIDQPIYRRLSKGERRSLHWRLAAGIMLRLVYETFRILSTAAEIEAIGTRPDGDREAPVMRLRVTRARFAAADLEERNHVRLFRDVGGEAGIADEFEMAPIAEAS